MILDLLSAFRLCECPYMTERKQVLFPKTKKRRIQKKWTKRAENWAEVPLPNVIVDEASHIIYGHPTTLIRMRGKLGVQP